MIARRADRTALGLLAAACLVPLVWIRDISFINDEPLLIAAALKANREGVLAPIGLLGPFGFSYGPVPTWVYQVLLATTHDILRIATIHALLMTVVTACALWWISRSLSLWTWFLPLPLLSPYFWFYSRVLWDNPLLIPLGALAIAGYASHLRSGSPAGLRVSLAATAAIPLVHLMSIALVAPLAVHMLVVRRRTLWANRLSVGAILGAALAAAWPYWRYLATSHPPGGNASAGFEGWLFPLAGARLLSARQLDYFFGPGPVEGLTLSVTAAVSWIAYALVWTGIGVALWRVVRAMRTRAWSATDHIAAILVGALACQVALDGFAGKFEHPQYQNATWIATVVFAWFAADFLAAQRGAWRLLAPLATGLLGAALLVTVATLAARLHRTGGTRETYGPTLANQLSVAQGLSQYSPRSPVSLDVKLYQDFPHALTALRLLNPPPPGAPERDLHIRYASANPASGRIQLVER